MHPWVKEFYDHICQWTSLIRNNWDLMCRDVLSCVISWNTGHAVTKPVTSGNCCKMSYCNIAIKMVILMNRQLISILIIPDDTDGQYQMILMNNYCALPTNLTSEDHFVVLLIVLWHTRCCWNQGKYVSKKLKYIAVLHVIYYFLQSIKIPLGEQQNNSNLIGRAGLKPNQCHKGHCKSKTLLNHGVHCYYDVIRSWFLKSRIMNRSEMTALMLPVSCYVPSLRSKKACPYQLLVKTYLLTSVT